MSAEVIAPAAFARDAPARPLPTNVEAERAFLGALLFSNAVFGPVAGFLRAEHFSEELHRRLFEVCAAQIGDGRLASPITVKPFLGEHDLGGGTTVHAYLARLCAEACPPVAATDYGRSIRDMFVRREIIAAAGEAQDQAFDAPADMRPAAIASGLSERLGELTEEAGESKRVAAGASAYKLVAKAQAIMNGDEVAQGVSTGFADLDDATGGYRPGELWVIAGRPGMGKSVLAVTSATKVARKEGNGVLIFSLELPEDQFTARILADMAYTSGRPVTYQQIMRGRLDDKELWLVNNAQRELSRMALYVDYSSRLTVSDIRARVHLEHKRMRAAGKTLRLVMIDYLKFIQSGDRYRGNRVNEVGEITAGLKQVCKDEEVCIALLTQLNRALEGREDKRPGLSDLRESGDIEQDSDVCAFVHREAYFVEKSPGYRRGDADAVVKFDACKTDAEIILGKNRAGPTTTIHLWANVACSTMAAKARGYGE